MRLLRFVSFLVRALAAPRAAAEGYEVIILGGGADKAAAQAFVDGFKGSKAAQWIAPASGYPKVEDSGKIAGLNKGFQIAVLGFCTADSGTAGSARDLVNYQSSGAYTKAVKASFPNACPTLKGRPAVAPKGFEQAGTAPLGGGLSSLEWRVYTRKIPVLKPGRTWSGPTLVLQVVQGGRFVDEAKLTGEARAPEKDAEGDYGDSTVWKFGEFVNDGARAMVWVTEGKYGGDTGSLTHHLYGLACGEIKELIDLGSQIDPCCGPPVSFELTKGAKRGTLKLVINDPTAEEQETTRDLAFDGDRCAVVEQ